MAAQNRFCFIFRTVAPGEKDGREDVGRAALHQHDVARFDRHNGGRGNSDPQVA